MLRAEVSAMVLTPRPHLAVWGARRYGLLLCLDAPQSRAWAQEMARICVAAVA